MLNVVYRYNVFGFSSHLFFMNMCACNFRNISQSIENCTPDSLCPFHARPQYVIVSATVNILSNSLNFCKAQIKKKCCLFDGFTLHFSYQRCCAFFHILNHLCLNFCKNISIVIIFNTLLLLLLLLLSHLSRVRLYATPQTAAHQARLSLGFSRQEYWSGLPFPSPVHESEK